MCGVKRKLRSQGFLSIWRVYAYHYCVELLLLVRPLRRFYPRISCFRESKRKATDSPLLFRPETAKRTLAEIDELYERKVPKRHWASYKIEMTESEAKSASQNAGVTD